MTRLSQRLGSATFVLILLAGLMAISQSGTQAFAQTDPPTATGDTFAGGDQHTCALLVGGQVQCWGANDYGQLGDGTTDYRASPVAVTGLAGPATALTAGAAHTCAVLTDGRVQCWGVNMFGQLGDGTTTNRLTPVTVDGLAGTGAALTAHADYTCALLTGGQVQCWGNNFYGQLGDGTTTNRLTPVTVDGLAGTVDDLTAGVYHTCALLADGRVQCWGSNSSGQLGDGTTTNRLTPVTVVGLDGTVDDVTSGALHTCAVLTGGDVQCWGWNVYGQLGDGTTTNRPTPVTVDGLAGTVDGLTSGGYHTCALLTGGQVQCWGSNLFGQLGDGTTTDRLTPVTVTGLTGPVTALTAGTRHTCALFTGGQVQCWGNNAGGQLGDGTTTDRPTPVTVTGLAGPVIQPGGLLNPPEPPDGGSLGESLAWLVGSSAS